MTYPPQKPTRPTHLPAYADVCLQALVEHSLSTLADPEQAEQATLVRAWYRTEFLHARLA